MWRLEKEQGVILPSIFHTSSAISLAAYYFMPSLISELLGMKTLENCYKTGRSYNN